MGIEPNIGDNPSTTDTPWGTAGQAAVLCPGGSNIKDLTGYF